VASSIRTVSTLGMMSLRWHCTIVSNHSFRETSIPPVILTLRLGDSSRTRADLSSVASLSSAASKCEGGWCARRNGSHLTARRFLPNDVPSASIVFERIGIGSVIGAPGGIRIPNLLIRRAIGANLQVDLLGDGERDRAIDTGSFSLPSFPSLRRPGTPGDLDLHRGQEQNKNTGGGHRVFGESIHRAAFQSRARATRITPPRSKK
jgi:hypothetical protein